MEEKTLPVGSVVKMKEYMALVVGVVMKETEKDDGWYCDSGCSGCVDISADQSTDIYQGPDQ